MKRKNKVRKIIVILALLGIIILIWTKINYYKLTGDFTSSGATRKYEAVLIFFGNSLVKGKCIYNVGEGGGCTSNCEKTTKCIIQNQNWIDSESGGECSIYNYIPTNRSELEDKIKTGEIKSFRQCGHSELCYRKTFY